MSAAVSTLLVDALLAVKTIDDVSATLRIENYLLRGAYPRVVREGDLPRLGYAEALILLALFRARGGVVSRQVLVVATAGGGESNVVNVHLCRLRTKLLTVGIKIRSVYKVGWALEDASLARLVAMATGAASSAADAP